MDDWIVFKVYFHQHEAELARGLLTEAGIQSVLKGDDCGGFRPHLTIGMGNYQLKIHPNDVQEAREILQVLDEEMDGENGGFI